MKKQTGMMSIVALFLILSLLFTGIVSAYAVDVAPGAEAEQPETINIGNVDYLWVEAMRDDEDTDPYVAYGTDSDDDVLPNGSTVQAGNVAEWVEAFAMDGGQATVKTGDVKNPDAGYPVVEIGAYGEGTSLTVKTGDVESAETAVTVDASGGAEVTMETGDLTGLGGLFVMTGQEEIMDAPETPTTVQVTTGDISGEAGGVMVEALEENSRVDITTGSVSGAEEAVMIQAWSDTSVTFLADGDLTAEGGAGLVIGTMPGAKADAAVTGTISGGMESIVVWEGSDAEAIQVTAWKVRPDADGHFVTTISWDDNDDFRFDYDETAQAIEENILYIIKTGKSSGGKLRATDAEGNALEKSHGYDVAKAGDTVLLKVDVKNGYKVTGAYNGDGKKVPLKKINGDWYVEVQPGGGVYLTASFSRTGQALLFSLKDLTGKISMNFYPNGSVIATMEDGSKAKGVFELDGDSLVLVDSTGNRFPVGENGAFSFASPDTPEAVYEFRMETWNMDKLLAVLK